MLVATWYGYVFITKNATKQKGRRMKHSPLFLAIGLLATASLPLLATPAEDMLKASEKSIDGLVSMAKGAKNKPPEKEGQKGELDPVAWEALILSYADVPAAPGNFYRFKSGNKTDKAIRQVLKEFRVPHVPEMAERLLANESPAVRAAMVARLSGGFFGNSKTSLELIKGLLDKEKSPVVIAAIIRTFANDGGKVPEIGAFLVRQLGHEDPVVRRAVVCFAPSSWNFKTPGLAEKLAEMLSEEKDPEVRAAVLTYACKLGNDVLVEPYVKALSDADSLTRGKALEGLVKMWWAFPLYDTHSEKAYRASLKALGEAKPGRALALENSRVFNTLALKNSQQRIMDKWAGTAPWYVAADVRKVLLPWFQCGDIPIYIRTNILKALYSHGMPKDELSALMQDEKFEIDSKEKPRLEKALNALK